MSVLAVGYIFQTLLKPHGSLNELIGAVLGRSFDYAWLGETTWSIVVVALAHVLGPRKLLPRRVTTKLAARAGSRLTATRDRHTHHSHVRKSVSRWRAGYHVQVSNPIEENATRLAHVLDRIEQAAEQAAGWLGERDRLVLEAKALGGSHRQITSRADLSHADVGELILRDTGR